MTIRVVAAMATSAAIDSSISRWNRGVVTKTKPHPVFTRHGADLHRELLISLHEALLGGEVPVATLRGKVLLTIPAGTQTGRVFRLTGQGMPRLKGDGAASHATQRTSSKAARALIVLG